MSDQTDNILAILAALIAIFKAIDIYIRKQQTEAAQKQVIAQNATAKALEELKK